MCIVFDVGFLFHYFAGLALERKEDKDASKRHTMSHPPDHIPELDSPRQSRSPLKKGKKEQVSQCSHVQHLFITLSQSVREHSR